MSARNALWYGRYFGPVCSIREAKASAARERVQRHRPAGPSDGREG
jgi:hypothetical protein